MTEVRITESDQDPTDLARQYEGQSAPQPVYVELDTRDGELSFDYDGNVGGGTTPAVRDGVVLRFPFRAIPTVAAANAVLARLAPLAQAVLDTEEIVELMPQRSVEDGPGKADDDYSDALDALRSAVDESLTDADIVTVWSLDGLGEWIYEGITAETTDEELAVIEAGVISHLAEGYGAAICTGLTESLAEERDSLRAGETV
jgi:hypothetical protein